MNETDLRLEKIVKNVAKQLYKRFSYVRKIGTIEDVWQEGLIGILKAKQRYNNNLEVPFETYCSHFIYGSILDAARKSSMVRIPSTALRNKEEIKQTIQLDAEVYKLDRKPEIDTSKYLNALDEKSRYIVRHVFGLDGHELKEQKQISAEIGLSAPRVSVKLKKALEFGRHFVFT